MYQLVVAGAESSDSYRDELPSATIVFTLFILFARAERFELPSAVLETVILPLNYARKSLFKAFVYKWQNGIPLGEPFCLYE